MYGVPESLDEKPAQLVEAVVKGVFLEKLDVPVKSMERIHRLGQRRPTGSVRPVIVKFYDFTEKNDILFSAYKLKGTNISISEDFSVKVRHSRANLWKSCLDERREGTKATLKYDKLVIGKDVFTWDDVANKRIKLRDSA